MNNKKEGRDLTQGNLVKNMLIIFFPLLFTNLLNSIYNVVDGIWIGRIVGENGVSVSANVHPILFLVMAVGYGLATSTSVLISQYYGAKDNKSIKTVVKVSVISTALIILVFNLINALFSNIWLKIMGTPQEVWNETRVYFIIYLVAYFLDFMLMNIMESLRAIGNTKLPIIIVTVSSMLNIVIDPILLKTPLGISGAAIATVISILVGLVIAIIYVNTQSEILNWNFKGIKFDKKIFYKFLKVAIPMILQEWFIGLVMLYEVKISNRTGVEGSASYGVVNKLEQVVWILGASFNSTVRIFVGQFFGDKKYEESKDIMFKGMLLELIPNIVIGTLIYVIPYQLCRIFLSNDIVIQSAIRFLRVIGIVMISTLPRSVVRGFFGGTGHTRIMLVGSIASGVADMITMFGLSLAGVDNLIVIGIGSTVYTTVESVIYIVYYYSNKWKKNVIEN